jgi:hypothetical protein
MASKKQPSEPSLRTILEDVRSRVESQSALFEDLGSRVDDVRSRVDSQGALLADMGVRVDSQSRLLEEMRSQNSTTIEAVEVFRAALEQRIERLDQDTRARDGLLELAIRDLRVSVQQNSLDIHQNSLEIRDVAGKVETLVRLEERVAAIERRLA